MVCDPVKETTVKGTVLSCATLSENAHIQALPAMDLMVVIVVLILLEHLSL